MAGVAFDPTNCKSLYIGNLHPYVNEQMLQEIFTTLGSVVEVKVIKDRVTGMSAGYGFVTFTDHRVADLALQCFNGRVLYGQEVRVNWAFQKDQREDTSAHFHTFVGDLSSEKPVPQLQSRTHYALGPPAFIQSISLINPATDFQMRPGLPWVNDRMLYEAFAGSNAGCSDARVMWDHNTGRSKGYGFVSFRSQEEAEAAINKMNGEFIGHRRVRCSWAQHKQDLAQNTDYNTVDKSDPFNANVYVGNVSPELNDGEIRRAFTQFGNVLEVKTYRKGSYGFVQFQHHEEAVRAIVSMNGQKLGGKALKCSWGRHQNRAPREAMAGGLLGVPPVNQMGQPLLGHHLRPFLGAPQNLGRPQPGMLQRTRPPPTQQPLLDPAAAGPSLPHDSSLPPMHGNPFQSNPYQANPLMPDPSSMLYGSPYYGP